MYIVIIIKRKIFKHTVKMHNIEQLTKYEMELAYISDCKTTEKLKVS